MVKRIITVLLVFCMSFGTVLSNMNVVFASEETGGDDRAIKASNYFQVCSTRIDGSSGGGLVQTGSILNALNVNNAVLSGEIQELRNGIWYTVSSVYGSDKSGYVSVAKSYNGVKGRTYRINVTFTVYTNSGTETRTVSASTVAQ